MKGLSKKLKHIDDIENEIDVICKETKINENLEMMKSLKEIYENGDTKKDKIRKKFDKDSDFELFLQLAEKYGLIKKCIYKGEEYYYLGSTGHHILNRGYRN